LLEHDVERIDWTFIWERIHAAPDVSDDDRRKLYVAGHRWLSGHEDRQDWGFIWEHLLAADPAVSSLDRASLLKAGAEWLRGREDSKSWTYIWQHLAEAVAQPPELMSLEAVTDVGNEWVLSHPDHTGSPITAAKMLALCPNRARYERLAAWLTSWLASCNDGRAEHVLKLLGRAPAGGSLKEEPSGRDH
jgi:hypothetical protein